MIKSNIFHIRTCFLCCVVCMVGNVAYADNVCPSINVSNDPFSDFNEVMTEEEKRQALHQNLKQKLSLGIASCPPISSTSEAMPPSNSEQGEGQQQAEGQGEGQQQAEGQSEGQQQAEEQSEGPQQAEGQGEGQQQAEEQANKSMQSVPSHGVSGQETTDGGESSWDAQQAYAANSGIVSLEPMSPSSNSQSSQSRGDATKYSSHPAVNVVGVASSAVPSEKGVGQPSSEFLKKYGNSGNMPGVNSRIMYKNATLTAARSQTIKADAGAIKKLQERLGNENDPEMRKQIQAEIDRLRN